MRTGFYLSLACAFSASANADDFAEVGTGAHAMLPQLEDAAYEAANLFLQISTNEPGSLTNVFTQANSIVDAYVDNMPAAERERFENVYAQIRNLGYDFLAQMDSDERTQIGQMLTQTEVGNWLISDVLRGGVGEEINNFFSQYDSSEANENLA